MCVASSSRNPGSHEWHALAWEHHSEIGVPGGACLPRRLARQQDRFPDDRRAPAELLERWDAGLTRNPSERRMAPRLAQQRQDRLQVAAGEEGAKVTDLASVRAVAKRSGFRRGRQPPSEPGDDDDPAELDALAGDELEGAYYSEAFGSFS